MFTEVIKFEIVLLLKKVIEIVVSFMNMFIRQDGRQTWREKVYTAKYFNL